MGLSSSSLRHPKIQFKIEDAMRHAVEISFIHFRRWGAWSFKTPKGMLAVTHDRDRICRAFRFFYDGKDVTHIVIKSLRESACES